MIRINKHSTSFILFVAIVLGILFSLIAMQRGDAINPDGILYLRTSQAFLDGGFHAAMQIYGWPFYAILIAIFSNGLHLSLVHAAQLLNLIFQSIIIAGFILLVKELGGGRREQWAAAIIFLVFPILNHDRVWFIRDFGYWAFFLIAIWQLIRFSHTRNLLNAILWGCAMAIATAFRIEGGIIWLITPLGLLITDSSRRDVQSRFAALVESYSVIFIIGMVVVGWWAFHPALSIQSSGRLVELLNEFHSGFVVTLNAYQKNSDALATAILNINSYQNASTILMGGLIAVFLVALFKTITPLFLFLFGHAVIKNLMPASTSAKAILVTCIIINIVVITVFVFQQQFVDGRYVVPLSLLFLCWTPFSLTTAYQSWLMKTDGWMGKRWVFPLVCILMFAMISPAFVQYGNSKVYLVTAGNWLNDNLPKDATLYTNSKEILFYAKRSGTDWDKDFMIYQPPFRKVDDKTWKQVDYLAFRFNHDEQWLEQRIEDTIKLDPLIGFANKRGDKVIVFKVPH
jgi:hypothetical protein